MNELLLQAQLLAWELSKLALLLYGFYVASYPFLPKNKFQHPVTLLGSIIAGIFRFLLTAVWSIVHFFFSILTAFFVRAESSPSFFPLLKKQSSTHFGSARYLEGWGKFKLLNRWHKGLTLDGVRRINKNRSYQNVCMVAPTGSGKTTTYVIPNLLGVRGSLVTTDPSAEGYDHSSGWLAHRGFDIRVINVSDVSRSYQYNPLHRARSDTEIKKLTKILITAAFPEASGDTVFWNTGAENILNTLIKLLKKEERQYHNLANVRHLLNHFGPDGRGLDPFVSRNASKQDFAEWMGIVSQPQKVLQSFVSTARTALDPFNDPSLAKLTARDTLELENLRAKPTALYIIIPEQETRYYGFLTSLLYSQLFSFAMQQPGPKDQDITFVLEEFGNMAPIPGFSTLITTSRKKKISISLIMQDIEQATRLYGKSDASTILGGGCLSHLYLPGTPIETTQHLERLLGKTTIAVTDPETGKSREMGRNLLNADEIRTMSSTSALFIHANKHPVKLTMTPYYKHQSLKVKAALPPHPLPENDQHEVAYLDLP